MIIIGFVKFPEFKSVYEEPKTMTIFGDIIVSYRGEVLHTIGLDLTNIPLSDFIQHHRNGGHIGREDNALLLRK